MDTATDAPESTPGRSQADSRPRGADDVSRRAEGAIKTVLYVEDVEQNVQLMKAIFELKPQWRLLVAYEGLQALQMAAQRRPDLLMLDLGLPDCHASELLHLLRKQPGLAGVPAVAVTADHDFRLAGTGFREIWPKPIRVAQVLERLDELLVASSRPSAASSVSSAPIGH
jgi:CheY-like chemotaxis protein